MIKPERLRAEYGAGGVAYPCVGQPETVPYRSKEAHISYSGNNPALKVLFFMPEFSIGGFIPCRHEKAVDGPFKYIRPLYACPYNARLAFPLPGAVINQVR